VTSALFHEPQIKMLYHTAEKMEPSVRTELEKRKSNWRFYTRNLIGSNNGSREIEVRFEPNHDANTLHEYPEHFYYGGGFDLSASKDGCFEFKVDNKVYYFDISLESLPYKNVGDM
jgi:hypothetical protein